MPTRYNLIAGGSVERLAALSDGVFAVAMTLLLLDLHAPAVELIHSDADLARALLALAPRLLVYVMSFMTLGIFWVGQQTQLNHLARSDRDLTWLHLGFLFTVTIMPFSTAVMAEFLAERVALLVYWFNIFALGGWLYASWSYACRARLMRPEMSEDTGRSVERRILVAQSLYAVGAALCALSTTVSLAVIVVVQLNYVIAPRIWPLSRL